MKMRSKEAIAKFWLIECLDEAIYPELKWEDVDNGIFTLKWPRIKLANHSNRDYDIFKHYQLLKGKPIPENSDDLMKAKRNLRATINKEKKTKTLIELGTTVDSLVRRFQFQNIKDQRNLMKIRKFDYQGFLKSCKENSEGEEYEETFVMSPESNYLNLPPGLINFDNLSDQLIQFPDCNDDTSSLSLYEDEGKDVQMKNTFILENDVSNDSQMENTDTLENVELNDDDWYIGILFEEHQEIPNEFVEEGPDPDFFENLQM